MAARTGNLEASERPVVVLFGGTRTWRGVVFEAMTYPEALEYLGRVRLFGSKLGLDNIRELTERMGRPQDRLRFIHVAGTNGKGSVVAMLDSCLRLSSSPERGTKVGMFTSPHLVCFNERICVDGLPIPDEAVAAGVEAIRPHVEAMAGPQGEGGPTYFEIVTALALWHFADQQVDWVAWETGLGGRLDATNIVEPDVCIITPVARDHAKWLGETIPAIAAEKVGILKPGVPAVTCQTSAEALEVIERRASEVGAPLTVVGRDVGFEQTRIDEDQKQRCRIDGREFQLGLLGEHQVGNAACVVAALRSVAAKEDLNLSDEAIHQSLSQARWPGRFDIVRRDPPLVLDGAHNVAAIRTLVSTWRTVFGQTKMHLVCGLLADKDTVAMLEELLPLAERATFVGLHSERSADPEELANLAAGVPAETFGSLMDAWPTVEEASKRGPLLLTGSLYLVGEALARLDGRGHELALNEHLTPKG